ncbi:NAD(P)/FAD-dependent oxidoreductase [Rivibacter subsaxonicus]|uniref:Putative flavoprotein involved in K+ transport n=1 Tax=Rivibacter subsaxonicus TaxID=457575 RepID=A0A4Q7V770_9BURK|nr:NAD(P)/FAD-dependent oxidoreductase [Rivibacter subsaxonicus]RZT92481.1 putative flavoprotein involved in K+ transport [Rivibacter subsaxonicus]
MSDATQAVKSWLAAFGAAIERGDHAAAAALFDEDCYWRDLVSFTWNIKTMEGRAAIRAMLDAVAAQVRPSAWAIDGEASAADGVTEAWITFETAVARGKGHIRLKGDKCWTLLTTMVELKGFEEPRGAARPKGVEHGALQDRKNWAERRAEHADTFGISEQPYVLIVGGGQGGIGLGARLKRLGVPALIVEKNERPGDSWRKRYKSLCLHDPVWYDHMPYLPFPDHWPVFSPKDKIGDWLEMYTRVMELDYWGSTECKSAKYDEAAGTWEVQVERGGKPLTLRPTQLVLATGMSAVPNVPHLPGAGSFKGEQHHSSRHGGGEAYRGKKCVVIGSNNSAHDICADLWEHGADVTMVQRSSTHIARSDSLMELALGGLYSEEAIRNGIDHHKADLIFASVPYKIMAGFQIPVYEEMKKRDAELYARLEKAGFMLDFGDDGSGLFMKYLRRGSGYYIDVGASELVANGQVKLKSGVAIERIKEHSILFADGTELPADLIVYATGYGSMNGWAARLISQEVADKVGKCWGLGSDTRKDPGPWEGELRNMWKPTRQPALWFHGGNLHQSRHYSQFLSLQLKARKEGIPTPVYGLAEVHHLS